MTVPLTDASIGNTGGNLRAMTSKATNTRVSAGSGPSRLSHPIPITEQDWPKGTVPVVSVVCTTYNHEKFIPECLDGFLMQETTFPVEIIVHDDASTDRTPIIIREYESRYPRLFRVIVQTENQRSRGRRILPNIFALVQGEYIAFCDGDDYWVDNQKLQKQLATLAEHRECVGVFHWVKIRDEPSGRMSDWWPRFKLAKYTLDDFLEYGNFISSCSILTRFEYSTEFQRFNLGSSIGDFSFHIMNLMHGPYAFIADPMAVYRHHPHGSFSSLSRVDQMNRLLETKIYLGARLGLSRRKSFKNGIALNYRRLRELYANEGNVKETLLTTLKYLRYASWRRYGRILIADCKFLLFWCRNKLPPSIKNPLKKIRNAFSA